MNIIDHIERTRDKVRSNTLFISKAIIPELHKASTNAHPYLSQCKTRFMGMTIVEVDQEGIVCPTYIDPNHHWNQP